MNAFFYPGTIGVLSMLVAYFVIQFGAAKFLHLERREPRWRAVILLLATAAIVYTFYKQVWPRPAHPYDVFPFLVLGWCVIGIGHHPRLPGADAPDRRGPGHGRGDRGRRRRGRQLAANSSALGTLIGWGAGCVIRSGLPNGSRSPQSTP